MTEYDVAIIGSGPAALTAAIYCGRALAKTLVLAGQQPGGQLMLTTRVENFPGFPSGVDGPDLIAAMTAQAREFGAEVSGEELEAADFSIRPFRLVCGGRVHTAKTVIVATGASAKWLDLPSEQRLIGRGVSSCAPCDGPLFSGKRVVVVGGGDSAVEEALFLTKYAREVRIVHRRNKLRASEIMQRRATANRKISFLWNSVVEEIIGDKKVSGVRMRNTEMGIEAVIGCEGVFVAIGHRPNTRPFIGQLGTDPDGYVKVADGTRTTVKGVFAAGDVCDRIHRQAVTAAGDGCKAALDALADLESAG